MQLLTSEFPSAMVDSEDEIFVLPTSFAQQRLWFFDLLAPGGSAYNLVTALRVRGALDVSVLKRSVNEIVRRHEVLRTTFATVEGEARQVISANVSMDVRLVELDDEELVREEVKREAQTPFNLKSGPLVRLTVLRLSEREHVMLLVLHHIISDGWSMGLLVQELSALYGAYASGRESPLAELPLQYADYAMWQREWLQGEVLAEQMEYWREQLRGAPEVLELASDRPRAKQQSYRGAQAAVSLSAELTEGLKQLSRAQGTTLFITLLAGFQVLLSRYSNSADVVVGSPIANRNRSELEGLIGFFVNTLVLRGQVRPGESFRELLQRVREVCLGAYAHQDVPFEQLVEELQPERSLSYQPLCQVLFALQNAPQGAIALEGLSFEPVAFESSSCRCDLTVSLTEVQGALQGVVEYSTDLFEAATIRRLVGHWEQLLTSIVADPETRVGELRMLSTLRSTLPLAVSGIHSSSMNKLGIMYAGSFVSRYARNEVGSN